MLILNKPVNNHRFKPIVDQLNQSITELIIKMSHRKEFSKANDEGLTLKTSALGTLYNG